MVERDSEGHFKYPECYNYRYNAEIEIDKYVYDTFFSRDVKVDPAVQVLFGNA